MRHIYVCRHGQGDHNILNVFNSNLKHPNYFEAHLTPLGREQAKNLGKKLINFNCNFEKVFISELPRTLETYQAINEVMNLKVQLIIDSRLNEVRKGRFESKSIEEFPYHNWDNRFGRDYEGETEEDVMVRVESFFKEYFINNQTLDNDYLIITHGTVGKNIFERFYGTPVHLELCEVGKIRLDTLKQNWNNYPENLKIQDITPKDLNYSHGLSLYSYEKVRNLIESK